MISVLLTLLKIIGIVLLSFLGLLLVLFLIVLFVPVRYHLKGYYTDEFVCHLKATWLLHLVSFSLDYKNELITSIKILGMDISSYLDKRESTISKPNQAEDKTSVESNTPIKQNNNFDVTANISIDDITSKKDSFKYADNKNDAKSEDVSDTSSSLLRKFNRFIERVKLKIQLLYNKICNFIFRIKIFFTDIKSKKETVERYIEIIKREEVKQALSLCKKRFFKMINHLLPKRMKVHIHIGMENPEITAYIAAFYNILPPKLQQKILLYAYFDKVILQADFTAKGSCNAIRFLYEILYIVSNKNCRTFYQLVKKEIIQ